MYEDYHEARVADFKYYIDRSDLSMRAIAQTMGIDHNWIFSVVSGTTKNPGEERVKNIIAFIKDYERLQTYYRAKEK